MGLKDPRAYTSIAMGSAVFPFDTGEGSIVFDPECSVSLDVAKPHGKDVPKVTVTGKEASKFKLDLTWSYRIEAQTMAFLADVSPVGPNSGQPLDITHPDALIFGIDAGIVERMYGLKRAPGGGMGSCSLSGTGWKKSPKGATGGAKVPGSAKPAAASPDASDHITFTTSDGNTIDMGEGPLDAENSEGNTYGFGGDDAPAVGE